jgi:N-acetylglucosaminyldiphosphoundecaprenol N-acetyl-beta-D-mannosaminyltransferase
MPLPFRIDGYCVDEFVRLATDFGNDKYGFVVTPNVDHFIRFHDDPAFRTLYGDAAYILLDSRFMSHVLSVTKRVHSKVCTGSDLTAHLFGKVIRAEDPIVVIGGDARQAQSLADRYGLKSVRHFNPPMGFIHDPAAVEECLAFIESHSPFRFCFLGVGSPQQEILAQQLKARGKARGLALCIGASINFLTGVEKRAPLWMQRVGAEWLFRLAQDPQRLARRYFVRGPRLFKLLGRTQIVLRPAWIGVPSPKLTTGEIQTQGLN